MTTHRSTSNTDVRSPYVEEVASDPDFRIRSGEKLLYTAPGMVSPHRPMVTWGAFRDDTPCLHFRLYSRKGNVYTISPNGVSFKLSEFGEIVTRVRELIASLPEVSRQRIERDAGI